MTSENKEKGPTWLDGFFGQYLRDATIHGVKYIGERDRHFLERLFWVVAVVGGFGLSIYLVEEVIRKFFANPVIISFQPQEIDISRIPFPAITLCNVNIMKMEIMEGTYKNLEKGFEKVVDGKAEDFWQQALVVVSRHLTHFCLAAPSFRRLVNETITDADGNEDIVRRLRKFLQVNQSSSEELMNAVHEVIKTNIAQYVQNASHKCEDMIPACVWRRKVVNCSEYFQPIETQHGACCVFNMMPRYILKRMKKSDSRVQDEQKYLTKEAIRDWEDFKEKDMIQNQTDKSHIFFPKHQRGGGREFGLSILVNPEIDTYSTCNSNDGWGFKVVAQSPISFPWVSDYGVAVPPRSEVFVNVEPELTTADESKMKYITPRKRGCYFPSDREAKLNFYKFYSASNCYDECIALHTYQNCSCVRYFMPRTYKQELCGAEKLSCAEEVLANLTSRGKAGECADCKPSCTEIQYKLQLSHFPLRNTSNDGILHRYGLNGSNETRNANDYSIVHIYLGATSINAKERKILYDSWDLLANAGGLLGLTLGFSIVSLVEIIYVFTMRVYFYNKTMKKEKEEEDDDEDDFDYYTWSSQCKSKKSAGGNKIAGYYNWALQTSQIRKIKVASPASSDDFQGNGKQMRRRGVPSGISRISAADNDHSVKPMYRFLS